MNATRANIVKPTQVIQPRRELKRRLTTKMKRRVKHRKVKTIRSFLVDIKIELFSSLS